MADDDTGDKPDEKPTGEEKPEEKPETPEVPEDEEFDKDRALETIRKQRENEAAAKKRAKELEAKVKEFEDRDKSEAEKTAEARAKAEKEAADARSEANRLRAAIKYGLDEEDLDLLGSGDAEQIEARAKRLAERFSAKDEPPRRPRERLRSGATSVDKPEKSDPASLAADVPRGW